MQDVPYGYCHCGCGGLAPIATTTHLARGYVKGEPRRYIRDHFRSGPRTALRWLVEDTGYSTPCHVWQMKVDVYGWEWCPKQQRERRAHLLAYERAHGEVPDGLELHHVCGVKTCVNPEHLKPMSRREHAVFTRQTVWERHMYWSGCP